MNSPLINSDWVNVEPPLVLTIDIGSSSTRVFLYDTRGQMVPGLIAQQTCDLQVASDGTVEDDADTAVERVARCVDEVLSQAGPLMHKIGAVAVDTLATTTLALDVAGRPLTPLITYADSRSAFDATQLRQQLDEAMVHERTGCLLRSSYWPARLAWLRRTQPLVWAQADRWVTLGEYMELCFFGRSRVSFSIASWSGLLDRRSLGWDEPLLDRLGLTPSHFSPLADVNEPLSGLRETYAQRWPALRNVPWFPAVGDGAAANIGSGCAGEGQAALTLGTTGAMRIVRSDVARVPSGLWCYRVDREMSLLGGATSEGGNVYTWLTHNLKLGTPAEVEAAMAAYPADGHGLTILPLLAGERSPGWAGNVQATFHGVTLATTPIDMVRASLEAVALRFAVIYERLRSSDQGWNLIVSGTALRNSPAWAQIFADVLGAPLVISAEPEATSRGAALLALRSLGIISRLESLPASIGHTYLPDDANHKIYQAAINRQNWLYQQVVMAKLD